jgi:cell division protein FtsA
MAGTRPGLIAALDVGSTKICCFVARIDGNGGIRVVGIAHQVSQGVKAGLIIDMAAAEQSIRATVDAAERMAGDTVERLFVNLPGGDMRSELLREEVQLGSRQIGENDLLRVLQQARVRAAAQAGERDLVHTLPAGFAIDGTAGYRDPRGMHGDRLAVGLHAISVAPGPRRNLRQAAALCHLDIEREILSPYAAGLAALVEDETDLGVTLIDMGGGTTSVGVFYDGHMLYAGVIPVGGNHVTNDLARGLATSPRHAERLKTLNGSAVAGPDDDRHMLSVPQLGENGADAVQQVPRSMLTGIIQPRIEETLELVRDRLNASGVARLAGRRAVLTGGAATLTGVRELAARILDKQVRIGRPLKIHGLAEATEGPAFSLCAGLLVAAVRGQAEPASLLDQHAGVAGGRVARIGRWFKENF